MRSSQQDSSRTQPPPHKRSGRPARMIIILLVVGVLAYFLLAGAAGNYIAENIIAPIFKAFDKDGNTPTPAPSVSGGAASPEQSDTTPSETETVGGTQTQSNIEFPGDTAFVLQMGAFSEKANADELANSVRDRGGAGYILQDGSLYRVMAAAYKTEDEARVVKDQLLSTNNLESNVYSVLSKSVALKVTADQAQLDALNSAFNCIRDIRWELPDLYVGLDKQTVSAKECQQQLGEMASKLSETQKGLDKIPGEEGGNGIISALKEMVGRFATELAAYSTANYDSDVVFSSKLKYTHIDLIDSYAQFVARLS